MNSTWELVKCAGHQQDIGSPTYCFALTRTVKTTSNADVYWWLSLSTTSSTLPPPFSPTWNNARTTCNLSIASFVNVLSGAVEDGRKNYYVHRVSRQTSLEFRHILYIFGMLCLNIFVYLMGMMHERMLVYVYVYKAVLCI